MSYSNREDRQDEMAAQWADRALMGIAAFALGVVATLLFLALKGAGL